MQYLGTLHLSAKFRYNMCVALRECLSYWKFINVQGVTQPLFMELLISVDCVELMEGFFRRKWSTFSFLRIKTLNTHKVKHVNAKISYIYIVIRRSHSKVHILLRPDNHRNVHKLTILTFTVALLVFFSNFFTFFISDFAISTPFAYICNQYQWSFSRLSFPFLI